MKDYEIIVIGAGIAGLSIGRTLTENGINNYLILEAQNKAGGRINTEFYKNGYIELGAQWIHGVNNNALYQFVEDSHLIGTYDELLCNATFLTENGLIDKNVVEEVWQEVKNSLNKCSKISQNSEKENVFSVGHILRNDFYNYVNNCDDTEDVTSLKKAVFNWILKYEAVDNACESLDDLSSSAWGDYIICGDDHVAIKNGYFGIIQKLLAMIPSNNILYHSAVRQILWKPYCNNIEDEKILLSLEDDRTFHCKHVFITCSLGYLKINCQNIFKPQLPDEYFKAIQSLGFGIVDKIFLEFSKPFWDPDTKNFYLVETENNSFNILQHSHNILLCWVYGEAAIEMENATEDEMKYKIMNFIKKFIKNHEISDPVNIVRSYWYNNKYIRGSYSYRPVNMEPNSCQILSTPIYGRDAYDKKVPLIYFAGEACHKNYYSTVHGAYISGIQQAEKFIRESKSSHNIN